MFDDHWDWIHELCVPLEDVTSSIAGHLERNVAVRYIYSTFRSEMGHIFFLDDDTVPPRFPVPLSLDPHTLYYFSQSQCLSVRLSYAANYLRVAPNMIFEKVFKQFDTGSVLVPLAVAREWGVLWAYEKDQTVYEADGLFISRFIARLAENTLSFSERVQYRDDIVSHYNELRCCPLMSAFSYTSYDTFHHLLQVVEKTDSFSQRERNAMDHIDAHLLHDLRSIFGRQHVTFVQSGEGSNLESFFMSLHSLDTRIIGISPNQADLKHAQFNSLHPKHSIQFLSKPLLDALPNLKGLLDEKPIDIFYLSGKRQSSSYIEDELMLINSLISEGGLVVLGDVFNPVADRGEMPLLTILKMVESGMFDRLGFTVRGLLPNSLLDDEPMREQMSPFLATCSNLFILQKGTTSPRPYEGCVTNLPMGSLIDTLSIYYPYF
jgi:hypothetical protein